MNFNLFDFLKSDEKLNTGVQKFMRELNEFLYNKKEDLNENTENIYHEQNVEEALQNNKESSIESERQIEETKLQEYRKEGHLYLVTEDRNGKIYLWDLTEKPKEEIEEVDFPKDLLDKATEGSVFKYTNGTYEFYSEDGYDMLFGEKNEE